MPCTTDHIVTPRIALQRIVDGLPPWGGCIDVSDFFHNDDLAFEQRRDSIARRLKASPWYVNADVARLDGVYDVVNDLAHSEDQEEFDRWWDELHDLSDHDRVFIHTR